MNYGGRLNQTKTMKRILTYSITATDHEKNILDFLKSRGYSHAILTHLKKTKQGILLNQNWARTRDVLHEQDQLTVQLIETTPSSNIKPIPMPLSILYEDEDLMIIDKPSNMPIHPSQGNYDNTLANGLCWYFSQREEPFICRCINRLDRDTTGLLIVATHMLSASLLSGMVANRQIQREYLALATGCLPAVGTINAPIARAQHSTIERMVDEKRGEYACTHYRRLQYENGYSLACISLDTGRTHQIRVHMEHIGHPLPGDFLYHPDYTVIKRQALHSHKLTFTHPITGAAMQFIAPLPPDMQAVMSYRYS